MNSVEQKYATSFLFISELSFFYSQSWRFLKNRAGNRNSSEMGKTGSITQFFDGTVEKQQQVFHSHVQKDLLILSRPVLNSEALLGSAELFLLSAALLSLHSSRGNFSSLVKIVLVPSKWQFPSVIENESFLLLDSFSYIIFSTAICAHSVSLIIPVSSKSLRFSVLSSFTFSLRSLESTSSTAYFWSF